MIIESPPYSWLFDFGRLLGKGSKVQVDNMRVALVGGRLVDHSEAKIVRLAIGTWHFDKCVYVANAGYIVRYEGLQLVVQLQVLRLVSFDIFENVSDFT